MWSPPSLARPWGGGSYPGVDTSDRTAPAEDTGQEVEIHLSGSINGGGGIIDGVGVYQSAEERGRTVHCYAIAIRPV